MEENSVEETNQSDSIKTSEVSDVIMHNISKS
jgi:hypothetical protein